MCSCFSFISLYTFVYLFALSCFINQTLTLKEPLDFRCDVVFSSTLIAALVGDVTDAGTRTGQRRRTEDRYGGEYVAPWRR